MWEGMHFRERGIPRGGKRESKLTAGERSQEREASRDIGKVQEIQGMLRGRGTAKERNRKHENERREHRRANAREVRHM